MDHYVKMVFDFKAIKKYVQLIFFSSLYRVIEQDIDVIRPNIYPRVFFVLKSLQF